MILKKQTTSLFKKPNTSSRYMSSIDTVAAVHPLNEDLMIDHQHVIDQLRQVRRQQDDEFFVFMEQNGHQQQIIDHIRQVRRQQDDELFDLMIEHNNAMRELNAPAEEQNVPEDPFQEIRDDYEDEVRYDYVDECARMGLPNPYINEPDWYLTRTDHQEKE